MISEKLTQVFNSLPPEAQQTLVENHLATLVDLMPKERSDKVLLAATRLQRKYDGAPKLDPRAKKKQIHKLLNELARDAKISFIKERSNREELLTEIVHSLMSWLNDIWSIVYEHNVNFTLAHTCLLFTSDALMQLAETSALGGCKCAVMNLPVSFNLRNKAGKILKKFNVLGPQNIDRILLWIWRDLFVTVLAKGSARDKKKIPEFLEEIESVLGVRSLERLLYGGRSNHDDEEYHDVEEEDLDYDRDLEGSDDYDLFGSDYPCGDENEDDYDSDEGTGCTCNLHANYWSPSLNEERLTLRTAVAERLYESFRMSPSLELSHILHGLNYTIFETDPRIESILEEVAGDSPENFAAALDIYSASHQPARLMSLIDSHSHLLRQRDTPILQSAVATLHASSYQARALQILEKELDDCIAAIRATVRACFVHIEDKMYRAELTELLKLRSNSPDRKTRVGEWVEKVITPVNGPANLMAFAAMMVGFPMMPGTEDEDDADLLNYVDLDQNDPDLDDLREEYRPNLRMVLDGWVQLGGILKGGQAILMRAYIKALEGMPWLRASDVSAEMANRLRERPNKSHVLNALVTLAAFGKAQRKKANQVRADAQRKAGKAAAGGSRATSSGANSTTSGASSSSTAAPAPAPAPTSTANSPLNSPPLMGPGVPNPFAAFFGAPPQDLLPNGNPPPNAGPSFSFSIPMFVGDMEDVD